MKKILATTLFLSTVFIASAQAGQGMYVSGNIGMAVATDADVTDASPYTGTMQYDSGLALLGAVGYGMDNFRIEGEVGYQKNDFDSLEIIGYKFDLSGDISTLSGMCNGYYDFSVGHGFTPFVTAGIGFAQVEINDYSVDGYSEPAWNDDDTVFAWQVGAGVGYAVSNNMTLEAKYRYFATNKAEFDDGSTLEFASHNFYVGMRYSF